MEREILVNKVKTILLKLIFPIEFIVSLCMTYSVFRFVKKLCRYNICKTHYLYSNSRNPVAITNDL